jgi:tRNA pseudouridine55 synthase
MMARRPPSEDLSGILVIDKPAGQTSHDIVQHVRRVAGIRRVGHAGTLDPMASGVLLVLLGEATKLGSFLTGHDKEYVARVSFGTGTDTLDAEGTVVAQAEVPSWLSEEINRGATRGRLASALDAERERDSQVPPAFSAIHVAGQRSYELARKGTPVELAARSVRVAALEVVGSPGAPVAALDVELRIVVSKGYYVRSLARDLGERLGIPAHLAALRRLSSGPFSISEAVRLAELSEVLRRALIPLAVAAARALPVGRLTSDGTRHVRHGQSVTMAAFVEPPPVAAASAWLDSADRLVAIGERRANSLEGAGAETADGVFAIHRGFVP